jgi:sporulation protein YlmC with PRC-barrel domain
MLRATIAALVVGAFAFAPFGDAVAQQQRGEQQRSETERWTPKEGQIEADQLRGSEVRDAQGQEIGTLRKLIIDKEEGKVTHAVIGVGGVLGIGERERVVEWDKLEIRADAQRDEVFATLDRDTLVAAPLYEEREAPAAAPAERRQERQPARQQ